MDLNQPIEFNPSSTSSPQAPPSLIPMSSLIFPNSHQQTEEPYEQDKASQFEELQKQNLQTFWKNEMMNIQNMTEFKSQNVLPLARIKKIMKSDKEVKMVSAEAPILFSKASELFILELAFRGWLQTNASGRRTIQRRHIARAIKQHELFDFLTDLVPCDHEDEETGRDTEGFQTFTGMQLPFHLSDTNGDFFLQNYAPPMSSSQLNFEAPLMPSSQFNFEVTPKDSGTAK